MEEKPKKQIKNYVRFSGAALQMGAIITGAALLGVWLDGKYNPGGSMYTLICTLTGVVIAMYLIIREVINMSKEKEDE
ncbi:putative F0F1-ATPase subunit [compost metagenome]